VLDKTDTVVTNANKQPEEIVEERIAAAAQSDTHELDLSDLGLTALPESISKLTGLRTLYLRGNQITALPEWIGRLTGLQWLHLDGNQLTGLPEWIGQLTGLQRLDLDGNQLTALPEFISKLAGLRTLYAGRNRLSALAKSIGQLAGLQTLYLGGNQLTALPESISKLTELQTLNLDDNQLTPLPEWISQLTELQALHLDGNRLTALPEWIGQLTELQALHLDDNQLTALPESISKLTGLQTLDLGHNQLTVPPEWIRQLTGLQTLHLDGNQLTALPEWIGQLTELQALNLDDNQLTALPKSIGQLTKLQRLDLDDNQLTALPESIGQLTKLQRLDLGRNQLTVLPESIVNLSQLKNLYLHGNSPLGLPAEVVGPSWVEVFENRKEPKPPSTILEYYFRSRQGRPLNEAKLILVGRGGSGKTSLVKRLVHDTFDAGEEKTEGIQITEWNIKLNGEDAVRLNVWDFGGQEIMHATHQFFLTERSLYLLVLNGREGLEDRDADYWLRLVESFGGNSPVIVVLNKIHEQPFDLNRRGLEQKYIGIREFIASDCQDATGIADLRRAIVRETDRLEDLRVNFPASWFAIKDRLASMSEKGEDFLDLDTYREECSKLGEPDTDAQDQLAGYLHSLGIALNFRNDPRLQDTHVLNPHWVTNGIYRIINAPVLTQQRGEIALNDLRSILDQKVYPARMHGFLLDLMRKFELCFPLREDSAERFLIPELLHKQEPIETAEFVAAKCLNFEYHYPELPEGLTPRFIVRTYPMSAGLPRWRSGVIVKFEGNRALVRGDVQERKVSISVAGPAPGRRNLLAIIRADMEHIHADIAKLQPKAMVPVPDHPSVLIEYDKLLKFEEKGVAQIQEVVGEDILTLDVRTLLNGVDVVGRGRETPALAERSEGARLFISYAHKDETLRAELDAHLKLFQRTGLIDKWDDRLIKPGEQWKGSIDQNLESADIILLLVSADFLNSDFCWNQEMERALERHTAGEAVVIPVIIRDCAWQAAKFAKLQALPKEGKAVTLWPDRDSGWRNVAEGIKQAADEIQKKQGRGVQDRF
jgi:internalin A